MLLGITDGLFVESHRMYAAERPFSAPRAMQPDQMTTGERAALERLLEHGSSVTDQSQRVADFLLAWWNAWLMRSYDITTGWAVDEEIADDMCIVLRPLCMCVARSSFL